MIAAWQPRIEGTWYGVPGLYDADGRLAGRLHAKRAVRYDERGRPFLHVDTPVDGDGPLVARFAAATRIELAVHEEGEHRVYDGPDIFGAGQPHGALLLGNDFLRPWNANASCIVQVLPDGETQAYSSLFMEGPTLFAVAFGLYRLVRDGGDAGRTLASFLADESAAATLPHAVDERGRGAFVGDLEVWGADSQRLGDARARLELAPNGAGRVARTITVEGALARRWTAATRRTGARFVFDGPDAFGNGIAYGRALFSTQYFTGQRWMLRGREVLHGDHLAIAWELCEGAHRRQVLFGLLRWEAA